ncbi:MAG: hypothetical protein CM15mP120_17560 [Pseudomonadota bacterium]|nr:MAG: hypothetical protein CM15mP120_17560 [Pseudomonadota bacterium]
MSATTLHYGEPSLERQRRKDSRPVALLEQRRLSLQQLNLTPAPDLPVSAAAEQICAAIKDHQVIIVAGETGSGKTTQLPKFCLQTAWECQVPLPIPNLGVLLRAQWLSVLHKK